MADLQTKKAAGSERSTWPGVLRNVAIALLVAAAVAWALAQGSVAAGDAGVQAYLPVVWLCALLAFVVQWVAFVPAFAAKTEHYYDLTGSLTYLLVSLSAALLVGAWDPRSLIVLAMIWLWAGRLGTFLFRRVRRAGGDSRFDRMKLDAALFFQAWSLQGLWVFLTLAAALAALTAPGDRRPDLGVLDLVGIAVWAFGWGFEVVADRQKSAFRSDPENRGNFISTGLWAWSRHPNYFGEIVLWTGVALVATPTLDGWRWAAWISPAFVAFLLTRVSGVPMLERSADRRWGGQREYELYKQQTPVLVPRPPRRSR
ncbi:MAG: DUF1295 domain-containing protein [Acidobacteria bacterium]|nr:MAG: DUF1295 domain-containing protein [Acidobacteriota bacterium]